MFTTCSLLSLKRGHVNQILMRIVMSRYILFLGVLIVFQLICPEIDGCNCPSRKTTGALITKTDMALVGHVRKTLQKITFIQCSLYCLKEDWCISVNFELHKRMGQCELNDYGIEDEASGSIEKGELEKKEGFVYSQLRPAGKSGCYPNRCQNGGRCKLDCAGMAPKCHCARGYKGDRCEVAIDECSSNPCQNGATCTDQVNGYSCTCPAGYSGTRCENDINECSSNPCQNGATCTDQVNGYSCTCPAGYSGTRCESDIDECSSNPCQNGATCTDQVNGYSCTCPAGYSGTRCENCTACDLYFPSPSTSNLVHANWSTSSGISRLTISFWIKVPSSYGGEVLPFSYATLSQTDSFVIQIKSSGYADVKIMNDVKTLKFGVVRNNTWQHCCFTWDRLDTSYPGMVLYYRNGQLANRQTGLSKDNALLSGGKLIIGQHQGSYGGSFDNSRLMVGHLAGLNIWSAVFGAAEVNKLYSMKCVGQMKGNVVSWADIIQRPLEGSTTRSCPTTCPSG